MSTTKKRRDVKQSNRATEQQTNRATGFTGSTDQQELQDQQGFSGSTLNNTEIANATVCVVSNPHEPVASPEVKPEPDPAPVPLSIEARDYLLKVSNCGKVSTLIVEEHVLGCWQIYTDEMDAATNEVGSGVIVNGEWRGRLWTFARHIKLHHLLEHTTAAKALEAVESVICTWATKDRWADTGTPLPAKVSSRAPWAWVEHFDMTAEDARVEFVTSWAKIKLRPGAGPLDQAVSDAKAKPLTLPEDVSIPTAGYAKFISIAAWLQVAVGAKPIALPTELIGERLGVRGMTITRYREAAIEDRFLKIVRDHSFRGGGGKATEFAFDVTRFLRIEAAADPATIGLWQNADEWRKHYADERAKRKEQNEVKP